MTTITEEDIKKLLLHFGETTYSVTAPDSLSSEALETCIKLMEVDYKLVTVSNLQGELSAAYPKRILIPDVSDDIADGFDYELLRDTVKLKEAIMKAQSARCRSRFPVPVIAYKGKYILRSATLAGIPEVYACTGVNYVLYGAGVLDQADEDGPSGSWKTYDTNLLCHRRSEDIKLLKALNVHTIVDLMIENKRAKFGLGTFSEKGENRYAEFNLMSMPYPSCDIFRTFKGNNYSAVGIVFNWRQMCCDAVLNFPDSDIAHSLGVDWSEFKQWDLVHMTQNYMKLIMRYLQEDEHSILVHCISGWDRTPLYISMLRLSLWADGVIHRGLNAHQIIYLTIAYDWYLFGHQLPMRLSKGEDILFFCFYMLKHLARAEYSIFARRRSERGDEPPAPANTPDAESSEEGSELELSVDYSDSDVPAVKPRTEVEPLQLPDSEDEDENETRENPLSIWRDTRRSEDSSSSDFHVAAPGGQAAPPGKDLKCGEEPETPTSEETESEAMDTELGCRKVRLYEIREIFKTCYGETIMLMPKQQTVLKFNVEGMTLAKTKD